MKPLFMSWKTYAKKLEIEIKYTRREVKDINDFFKRHDRFLNEVIHFKSVEQLIDYVKLKSEINMKISASFLQNAEEALPTNISKKEIELMNYANSMKDSLRAHMRNHGIFSETTQ